jgi:hypothetical protein
MRSLQPMKLSCSLLWMKLSQSAQENFVVHI